jgi:ketosteroid isomerase-like protein
MISTAFRAVLLVLLLGASAAMAQRATDAADHQALRVLKDDVVKAVNDRNLASIDALLHKPFFGTVLTQESFNDAGALRKWFEGLFTRPVLRLTSIKMSAEADELAQIHEGTFAVARGSTNERYELGDGRGFDIKGRWTATAIKQDGRWRILAIHAGTNFLDNPVINAIERHSLNFALGVGVVGAIIGGLLGFLVARRRYAKGI